jgi:pSer/pThr/pTyr-binding forkhead associated (FHA) protein
MASLTALRSGEEEETHELDAAETTIGREEGCSIRIEGLGLSRRHCTIVREEGRFQIRDLCSENGTWVNGERVTDRELRDGDVVGLGLQASFLFSNEDQLPPLGPDAGSELAQSALFRSVAVRAEKPAKPWLIILVALVVLALIAVLACLSLGG